ncbi:sialin-like isoform X2 [Bacillus rossius redtenbacheri]
MLLLAGGGTFVQMFVKTFLSVAIVAMVKSEPSSGNTNGHGVANATAQNAEGEFDWSSTMQGFLLSAFFYGYITTQVLGGWLSARFGPKVVMSCGMLSAGIFTLLGPLATNFGAYTFAASRILVGASTGLLYPPQQSFISKWIPPEEYQKTSGFMNSCTYFSTVVAMICAGVLSNYSWRLVFYVFGSSAIVWAGLCLWLAHDSPAQHPTLSQEEFLFITKQAEEGDDKDHRRLNPVPWVAILTSMPVWAQILMQCSGGYLSYTLMSEMPSYMKNILHFNIQNSGMISSLPYVFGGLSCTFFGMTSQWLQSKGIISHLAAYKIFNGIYALGAATCMFLVPVAEGNKTLVVMLLSTAIIFYNAYSGGSAVNMMDLGVNYVGITTGIMQTFANTMGIITPQVAGFLTDGQQTVHQWAKVFYIAGSVSIPTFIFYLFFGSVDEQEWNKQGDEETPDPATRVIPPKKKSSINHFANF